MPTFTQVNKHVETDISLESKSDFSILILVESILVESTF